MTASFAQAGAPALACQVVPFRYVINSLEAAAVQLCEKVPLQAEEYDRVKSESEFRGGLALPLGVLLGLLAAPISPFLLPVAAAVSVGLIFQSHQLRQQSRRLLAMCLQLGYARSPLLDGFLAAVKRMRLPEDASAGTWSAALAVAATNLGDWELQTQIMDEFYPGLAAEEPKNVLDFLDFLMINDPDGVWVAVEGLRKYGRKVSDTYPTEPTPVA
ncbi:hypothetical protein SAMN05660657_03302 [Geodermatophilus amargosae]|uniref:Uncharacterized protein n=2 Tax=Geodermatophilus amargosae TaxID=1296565 RepID=A0A1I7B5M8_9ACTN|nr:hypothetical protein SAMN05660657_03302 [Geodermatophilus amargosae]